MTIFLSPLIGQNSPGVVPPSPSVESSGPSLLPPEPTGFEGRLALASTALNNFTIYYNTFMSFYNHAPRDQAGMCSAAPQVTAAYNTWLKARAQLTAQDQHFLQTMARMGTKNDSQAWHDRPGFRFQIATVAAAFFEPQKSTIETKMAQIRQVITSSQTGLCQAP